MRVLLLSYSQATSLTNIGCQADLLSIAIWVSSTLNLLAQRANTHGLPVLYFLHFVEKLAGRAGRIHVTSDVLVDRSTLLKETYVITVGTNAVMGIFERLGNCIIGIHDDARLYE